MNGLFWMFSKKNNIVISQKFPKFYIAQRYEIVQQSYPMALSSVVYLL